jgi:hypothetical protein
MKNKRKRSVLEIFEDCTVLFFNFLYKFLFKTFGKHVGKKKNVFFYENMLMKKQYLKN